MTSRTLPGLAFAAERPDVVSVDCSPEHEKQKQSTVQRPPGRHVVDLSCFSESHRRRTMGFVRPVCSGNSGSGSVSRGANVPRSRFQHAKKFLSLKTTVFLLLADPLRSSQAQMTASEGGTIPSNCCSSQTTYAVGLFRQSVNTRDALTN